MIKYQIYNQTGQTVGDYELKDELFGVKTNEGLIHQAVVAQFANSRKSIADTKGRSEVRGGGKKPWRQKGTGRARAGSSRSPLWRGGGVIFGPLSARNFKLGLNKKMSVKAVAMAISDKTANHKLVLLDKLEMPEFKTKVFVGVLKAVAKAALADEAAADKKILIVNSSNDDKLKYSAKNLANVKLINTDNINIVDILDYDNLIMTVDAVKVLEARIK